MKSTENEIILAGQGAPDGAMVAAVRPAEGMTLRSLSLNGTEAICQARAEHYQACRKGYGPLIGPHFSQRAQLPGIVLAQMDRWPQAAAMSQLGVRDCWQHGVGRYAAWDYTTCAGGIRATLSGKHTFDGVPLRDIQGGDFEMHVEMLVCGAALRIHYTAEAAFPPVIGLHYYFDLPGDQGRVHAPVTGQMQPHKTPAPIPAGWLDDSGRRLDLEVQGDLDHIFPLRPGPIGLATRAHRVWIVPEQGVESLVVFHPDASGWVCVEPLSAANPGQLEKRRVEMSLAILIEQ